MQGLEMLLYGTGDTLYDAASKKWIVSSKGLTDSFNFLKTVFSEGLGPTPQDALDPQLGTKVSHRPDPEAASSRSTWTARGRPATGRRPASQALAAVQQGARHRDDADRRTARHRASTSMSGGWLLSVGAHAKNKQAAFDFIAWR